MQQIRVITDIDEAEINRCSSLWCTHPSLESVQLERS